MPTKTIDGTVADAYLFVMLTWAKLFKVEFGGNLTDFFERVSKRPAVQAALKSEGVQDRAA